MQVGERFDWYKATMFTSAKYDLNQVEQIRNILNQYLHNRMVDAEGEVQMFLSKYPGPEEMGASLLQCITSRRRRIDRCKHRHAPLKRAATNCVPGFKLVHIHEFGTLYALGRHLATKGFVLVSAHSNIVITSMILEKRMSNAFKHGCPRSLDVSCTIENA